MIESSKNYTDASVALTGANDGVHMIEKNIIGRHRCVLLKDVRVISDQRRGENEKFPANCVPGRRLIAMRGVQLWRGLDRIEHSSHDQSIRNFTMF